MLILARYPGENIKIGDDMEVIMKTILKLLIIFCVLSTVAHAGDCKEHIELYSAAYLANEYGRSETWVLKNVKINLWKKTTPQGKGRVVGKLLPGSRALIIEKDTEDYKVKSPYDKSIGWVNVVQVKRTLLQDTETRKPCTK